MALVVRSFCVVEAIALNVIVSCNCFSFSFSCLAEALADLFASYFSFSCLAEDIYQPISRLECVFAI